MIKSSIHPPLLSLPLTPLFSLSLSPASSLSLSSHLRPSLTVFCSGLFLILFFSQLHLFFYFAFFSIWFFSPQIVFCISPSLLLRIAFFLFLLSNPFISHSLYSLSLPLSLPPSLSLHLSLSLLHFTFDLYLRVFCSFCDLSFNSVRV